MAATYYPKYSGGSGSIVEALRAVGVDSSYANREKIAKANGITGYKGMAAQNTQMLNLLKSGKLIKSKGGASTKAATQAKKEKKGKGKDKKKKATQKRKKLGKWGLLEFWVTPNMKRTFTGLSWATSIKYDTKEKKKTVSKLKYKGIEPDTINLSIRLSVFAGLNPYGEIKAYRTWAREHKKHNLVIGGQRYGDNPMVLTNVSVDCKYFDNKGNLWLAEAKLTFKEKV